MVRTQVRKNAYYDSVTLMLISKELKKLSGIGEALVGMGTDLNKEIARNIGLATPELEGLSPNDLFIAVQSEDDGALQCAVDKTEELLNKKNATDAADYAPPTLDSALRMVPGLNMAVISVPGRYAPEVARECLDKDIHVMMFSDNVSLKDELELKRRAVSRGLLMMGPDCGTAIINHVPLAFANAVTPGDIGIVAASGTGAQEVSSLIDQLGGGISQLLATGGRDLKAEIGGLMFRQALSALIDDPATKVLALISKPPAASVQRDILEEVRRSSKPAVVCFIGGKEEEIARYGLIPAVSLEDAARKAVALSKNETAATFEGFDLERNEISRLVADERAKYAPGQQYLRGLFTGGTLCDEAMRLLSPRIGGIYSNIPLEPQQALPDRHQSRENTFLDFGDDEFTVGRPHPMIDPSLREQRLLQEAADSCVAVALLDCVIGYGSHPDPAGELANAVVRAKRTASEAGRHLCVVVSVCGTESDPQCLSRSREVLRRAGAIVMPSNAQAARFAGLLLEKGRDI